MDNLTNAKSMRSTQTPAEQHLWYHLRANRFMGLKFKRQKPLGPYIVDFICLERGVVIEVDGGQHGDDVAYDQRRDQWLASQCFIVLRFWNHDVLNQTESVLDRIRQVVDERAFPALVPSPPAPLP
ncbi:DNA (cytosine-5-)-methyltransferase [Rhodanobacter sp. Root480]|uniref:endonuclease domain-containing protein n=1 Tax=Rhodanobacter sp. Root480 TaxID=1736542 RepID=UPI0006F98143|nr:endonuclease domain-containing protein [Rhodanobacter sp. Root480]KQX98064.1 DNA (cytosine-5-)-methyltransferase [Rhodanobacter sp. Root480]